MEQIKDGDVLIALRSSGVHSNGFSLVRSCVEKAGLQWTDPPPFDSPYDTLGEALLVPTHIYVRRCFRWLGKGSSRPWLTSLGVG